MSLFYMVTWSLWNQRNRIVFDKTETDRAIFFYLVKLRSGFYLRGWNQEVPFNLGEIATKLECVKMYEEEARSQGRKYLGVFHLLICLNGM